MRMSFGFLFVVVLLAGLGIGAGAAALGYRAPFAPGGSAVPTPATSSAQAVFGQGTAGAAASTVGGGTPQAGAAGAQTAPGSVVAGTISAVDGNRLTVQPGGAFPGAAGAGAAAAKTGGGGQAAAKGGGAPGAGAPAAGDAAQAAAAPVTVVLTEATQLRRQGSQDPASRDDLKQGARVIVSGSRAADGTFTATGVQIVSGGN